MNDLMKVSISLLTPLPLVPRKIRSTPTEVYTTKGTKRTSVGKGIKKEGRKNERLGTQLK